MTGRRGAAVLLTVVPLAACLHGLLSPGYPGNFELFVEWARILSQDGFTAAYDGPFPPYPNYPPGILSVFWLVGVVYGWLTDGGFDVERALADQRLIGSIKAVFVAFHVATAHLVHALARRIASPRAALLAGLAYGVSPAAVYTAADWGTSDPVHGFFATAAVAAVLAGRAGLSGVLLGVALSAKPHALLVVPVLTVGLVRMGRRGLGWAAVGTGATSLVAVLPFLLEGKIRPLLELGNRFADTHPVVSAEAHNLWWLVTLRLGEDPYQPDSTPLVGGLSYETAGVALTACAVALGCWLAWRRPAAWLPVCAGFVCLVWFLVTTQAHANWSFLALPLLALGIPLHRGVAVVFGLVSVSAFLNLFLQDPRRSELLSFLSSEGLWWAGQANAVLGLAAGGLLAVVLLAGDRRAA